MAENKPFKEWQLEDIIAWCQANNQVAWLKTIAAKKVKRSIYPKVESISKTGKKTHKQDKTAKPIGFETTPITFVELKAEFFAQFMEKKEKPKKPTMIETIGNL